MNRRLALPVLVLAALLGAGGLWWRHRGGEIHYTGFVEGEDRVLRSEVSGRVLEVGFAEGDAVPAGAVVARLDDSEIAARMASKDQELKVLEAQIARQEEQVVVSEATWKRDVAAREAELQQAESEAVLAQRTFEREVGLVKSGASTAQTLDETRSRAEQARSAVARARDLLGRSRAEEGNVTTARQQVEVMRRQLELAQAQLAELGVLRSKHVIHAPDVATVVQTQLVWPGELAQPGTPIVSVLDPRDKYVQIYVPVADAELVKVGRRVEIELDSAPGRRVPGEVSFVADQANFTPEKIETRSDRMAQVYRAKVRILEDVERFQPGTEGNVYLVPENAEPTQARRGP